MYIPECAPVATQMKVVKILAVLQTADMFYEKLFHGTYALEDLTISPEMSAIRKNMLAFIFVVNRSRIRSSN